MNPKASYMQIYTEEMISKVKQVYKLISKKLIFTKNIHEAETAKAIENTQRDLNIALVNEFSIIFDKMKINTNEVLKAASTKWNFNNFKMAFKSKNRLKCAPPAPACGLYLKKINY